MTAAYERLRLYLGDSLIDVFGNRYTTDAFEVEVQTTDGFAPVTSAGLIGTVLSQYRDMKPATSLSFLGCLVDEQQHRINLKMRLFTPVEIDESADQQLDDNIIVVVGSV